MLGRLKQADRTAAVRPLKRARAEGSARAWTRSVLTSRRACMVALAASSQRLLMAQAALSVTHGSLQARIRPPPPSPPLSHRPPARQSPPSLFPFWQVAYVCGQMCFRYINKWMVLHIYLVSSDDPSSAPARHGSNQAVLPCDLECGDETN